MADNEQDTPQNQQEGQGEAEKVKAAPQPSEVKTAPEAPQADSGDGGLVPQTGETVEQYAARVRAEINWRDKQIGRQHRQLKEREEKLTKAGELESENQRLKELAAAGTKPREASQPPQPSQAPRAPAPTAPPSDAIATARYQIGMEDLAAKLQQNKDWPSAAKRLEQAGGLPQDVMSMILDTDDPAHVVVTLGKDMDRYQQILDLPEGKRRAALIKIGMEQDAAWLAKRQEEKTKEARKPSGAPAPTNPLPGAGGSEPLEDSIIPDQDDRAPMPQAGETPKDKYGSDKYDNAWYAARRRQKAESQGRPWSKR